MGQGGVMRNLLADKLFALPSRVLFPVVLNLDFSLFSSTLRAFIWFRKTLMRFLCGFFFVYHEYDLAFWLYSFFSFLFPLCFVRSRVLRCDHDSDFALV